MVSASSLSSTGSDSDRSGEFHYLYTEDGDRSVHRCHCDARLKVQREWELENLGRRFVRCPYRQVSSRKLEVSALSSTYLDDLCKVVESLNFGARKEFNCGYFAWIDPIFPTEATTVILDLLDTKSALDKRNTALVEKLNAKDVKIAALEDELAEAKGIAEWLSESDEERRKQLEVTHRQNRRLILQLKRHIILAAVLMAIVSAAVWFLK